MPAGQASRTPPRRANTMTAMTRPWAWGRLLLSIAAAAQRCVEEDEEPPHAQAEVQAEHERLGGRNPFSNRGVRYSGSHDDAALNAGVERFSADPTAVRDLSYDSDLTGRVTVPVLTLHAIDDPTAFVEHEAAYRDTAQEKAWSRHDGVGIAP